MNNYKEMSKEELTAAYEKIKQKNLKLDMSRGKPGGSQLDLVMDLLDIVNSRSDLKSEAGVDCRNYMLVDGLPEAKKLFSEIFECEPDETIIGGNASLNMMFDVVSQGMTHGFGAGAWFKQDKIKFLCPVPGYDRHFGICEHFGIEMINVDMTENGPDMDSVEDLVKDPSVKGMWCVPKYSNPQGITYSDETVRRIAGLKPAASDFRVLWDNAYAVHDLTDETDRLLPLLAECKAAGNPDIAIMFTSTSKITFPGAGVGALAASAYNIGLIKNRLTFQTIGPDKINQLRHVRKFSNLADINAHMKTFIPVLKPRFDAVLTALQTQLSGLAEWTVPRGGYFISVDVADGTAKRVVQLCKEAGVVLTPAGATYPYGKDPRDRNIRIAPTLPPVSELVEAMDLFCVAVKLAAAEK